MSSTSVLTAKKIYGEGHCTLVPFVQGETYVPEDFLGPSRRLYYFGSKTLIVFSVVCRERDCVGNEGKCEINLEHIVTIQKNWGNV